MLVYHYDESTREYLGSSEARADPMQGGQFIVPAHATDIEPPADPGANLTRRFSEGAWGVAADYRGTEYWVSGVKYVQSDFGDLPTGYVLSEPTTVTSSGDVDRERDRRLELGSSVAVTGYTTAVVAQARPGSDDASNLLGQVIRAQMLLTALDTTTTLVWRDGANIEHSLTATQMIDFAEKTAAWKQSVYAASWAVKALDPIPSDYADDSRWP